MKQKDLRELRSLDDKSLEKELTAALHQMSKTVFNNHQGNIKDTSQIKKLRTYIAQIKTIKSERKLEDQQSQIKQPASTETAATAA